MNDRKVMVDPPGGWRHGFPKELPEGKSYIELLRESGYPEDDIELALRWSRRWYEDKGDKDETLY